MLTHLHILNLALLDDVEVSFRNGFTAITGETGSGKSMLVDAISLVLGGRAKPELVRAGAVEAEVEALFEVRDAATEARLSEMGIPFEGELLVRRTVQAEGRSRVYLNGRLSTLGSLAELAKNLCDIASQHESVRLTDAGSHMGYLDAYAGLETACADLRGRVDAIQALDAELEQLRDRERTRAEREELLSARIGEIDALDPKLSEETELEHERGRLRHAEKLSTITRHAAFRLYEGDQALCDELSRLGGDIEGAASLDGTLAPFARTIVLARADLADAARGLLRYSETVEGDPERLALVEDRLFRLERLLRKHGPTTQDLLAFRADAARELAGLSSAESRRESLERERAQRLEEAAGLARDLSQKRRQAADHLADAIGRELSQLGMGRARVIVEVMPLVAAEGGPSVDGARLSRSGVDRVEFLIAPNTGEDPKPLRKIASGGELSRALLALKRVLSDRGPVGTYIFDEVDTGVSGAVAEVIGRAIADIAAHRQVLCITHLPQIAALADTHLAVTKVEDAGRTVTRVEQLSAADRTTEIAKMIGGARVTKAARETARELLGKRASLGKA